MAVTLQVSAVASGNSATPAVTINPAGANRLLLVALAFVDPAFGGATLQANIVLGAANMTQVGAGMFAGNLGGSVWRLIAPATGSAQVTAFFDAAVNYILYAAEYVGVDQTTPLGTPVDGSAGSGLIPDVTLGASASTSLLWDFVGVDANTTVVTAVPHGGQVQNLNTIAGANPSRVLALSSEDTGGGGGDMSWLLSASKPWASKGFEIRAVPVAGGKVRGRSRTGTIRTLVSTSFGG
jgi:hypothetical protein